MRRYEREKPGEMIHIDIKKLGRFNRIGHRTTGDRTGQSNSQGVGWEHVHVAVDDHSRIGFAKVMPSEKKCSAVTFLKAAVAYDESLGVREEPVSVSKAKAPPHWEPHESVAAPLVGSGLVGDGQSTETSRLAIITR